MSTALPDSEKPAVLYVDDEEQALKYFRRGLEKDFRVMTAASVADAMAILEKENRSIAVVITDQRMPGKSGVAMLTEVREKWPDIVRILVTAYTDIDSAVSAVNAGAVYKYVNKPADFPLLRQTLTEAINLYRQTLHRNAMAETLAKLEAQRRATEAAEAQREQLQQRLVAASRAAGRAEVATGILHNVGNVLNSMTVAASVISDTLEKSRVTNLCKGLAMLEEHSADLAGFLTADERGQRLPAYLSKLAAVLTEEHNTIVKSMESLARNIDHIAQVVKVQQTHAKEVVLCEQVSPIELMEESIRVNQERFDQTGVEIVREFEYANSLLIDKHRVLQILINLVGNAISAVNDSQTPEKRIVLRIKEAPSESGPKICFQVADTGVGIASENLTRMFTYGFTTKKNGHGFGLHSAANAAREMGGSLAANSDGPGMGATFTLLLPMTLETTLKPAGDPGGKVTYDRRVA